MRKAQREAILAKLEETYKGSKTALNYNSPFELLVAVILSAQCTDERSKCDYGAYVSASEYAGKNGRADAGGNGSGNPRLRSVSCQGQKTCLACVIC